MVFRAGCGHARRGQKAERAVVEGLLDQLELCLLHTRMVEGDALLDDLFEAGRRAVRAGVIELVQQRRHRLLLRRTRGRYHARRGEMAREAEARGLGGAEDQHAALVSTRRTRELRGCALGVQRPL